jgi:hypothetical protein
VAIAYKLKAKKVRLVNTTNRIGDTPKGLAN